MEDATPGTETPKATRLETLIEQRKTFAETALRGIFEVIVNSESADKPPELVPLLSHAFDLLHCGLTALNEIAVAQTILADLATRDFEAEVKAMAEGRAEALTEEKLKSFGNRSFIGQKA